MSKQRKKNPNRARQKKPKKKPDFKWQNSGGICGSAMINKQQPKHSLLPFVVLHRWCLGYEFPEMLRIHPLMFSTTFATQCPQESRAESFRIDLLFLRLNRTVHPDFLQHPALLWQHLLPHSCTDIRTLPADIGLPYCLWSSLGRSQRWTDHLCDFISWPIEVHLLWEGEVAQNKWVILPSW